MLINGKNLSLLSKTTDQLVRKVEILQKSIDSQEIGDSHLIAMEEQKRHCMAQLKEMVDTPIGAIGYVTACCITNTQLERIFDYQFAPSYAPNTSILRTFFDPIHLFPLFDKYNVLEKVDSIAAFSWDFPDLTTSKFQPALYDVLNSEQENKHSFSWRLAHLLGQEYYGIRSDGLIERQARHRAISAMEGLIEKGYPSIQFLRAQIALQKDIPYARELFNAVLRNKYASAEQQKSACEALSDTQSRINDKRLFVAYKFNQTAYTL